nr:thioesterase family protein [Tomitella biformata]
MHPFDDAISLADKGGSRFAGRTTPAFANMVGPFGGSTAAALLQAVLQHPDRQGDPLALTVNFGGAIAYGDFEVVAKPARTNRSNQHWTMEIIQNGEVTTTATAICGVRRESFDSTELGFPAVPAPGDVEEQHLPEFIAWAQNYEMRFTEGGLDPANPNPSESASSRSTLWIRETPARAVDFTALTAICDSFYPRVYLRKGAMMPASTVTFTVYFHADEAMLARQGDDYLLGSARAQRFGNGYFDQVGEVWSRDGELLATTHQLVYFKG